MKKYAFLLLFSFLFLPSAMAQKARIIQNPQEDYALLGTIERKVSNQHRFVKLLTLGIVRDRNYERMQHQLDKKLLKEARKKYGADAVANIVYWPAKDSAATVDYLYGRAEMIRFKVFTVKEVSAVPVQAPEAASPPSAL